MRFIRKGATSQTLYVVLLDSASTTGGRKTGIAYNTASLVGNYVRNGAARTAITLATLASASAAWSSGGFVEVDATNTPGLYRLDVPDAAFASGVDSVVITLKGAAGMVGVEEEVQLTAVDFQDVVRMAMTALPNAAAEAAGGLYTRGSGAGQINQNASGQVDSRTVTMATDVITAAAIQADAIGAAEIANGAIDAATFAAGAIDAAAIAAGAISSSEFAQAAADEVWASATRTLTGTVTVGTNNDKTGYALSAAGVQAVWDALTSALTTVGSIGKLFVDNINATISSRLASASYTAPDNADIVSILSFVDTEITDIRNRLPAALVGGRMDSSVGAMAAGVVTAAAVATNAIDADALAADAVAEIAAGVAVGSAPTAADNATAVWNSVAASFNTAGSMGQKLNAAGGAADPLTNAVPGAYLSGTAGYALGTLPWGVDSRLWTYSVTRSDNAAPIPGVTVYLTSDAAGNTVVYGPQITDNTGQVKFLVNAGTYYVWRQLEGYSFVNPDQETVT